MGGGGRGARPRPLPPDAARGWERVGYETKASSQVEGELTVM